MATPEEIRRRVEQADTVRSARRAAAAQQIVELAQRRTAVLEQLAEFEHELGGVLVGVQDVIGVEELAEFTDLRPADLTAWLAGRKTGRRKRQQTTATGTRRRPGSKASGTDTQEPDPRAGLVSAGTENARERLVAQAR